MSDSMTDTWSAEQLAGVVNRWCQEHQIVPANGQAGEQITERNIRYYRTLGLVGAPDSGGRGYRRLHRLQLIAIRLLQAQGLPLNRIRDLLYGRRLAELEEIEKRGLAELEATRVGQTRTVRQEFWSVMPLDEDFLLVSRRGRRIPAGVRERVLAALNNDTARTAALRHERKE
jgi:DNA-binding transcriptional MerR regulator